MVGGGRGISSFFPKPAAGGDAATGKSTCLHSMKISVLQSSVSAPMSPARSCWSYCNLLLLEALYELQGH